MAQADLVVLWVPSHLRGQRGLCSVQWERGAWRGRTHRFLDTTGKAGGGFPARGGWLHKILVAVSLPPLTFGSWGAHLSFLPRGAWNGSISCRGRRLASDKRSLWSLGGKGICSEKHRKEVVEMEPKVNSSEFIRFSASQVLITRGFLGDLFLPCDTVQQSKCQKSGQRAALTSEKVHEVLSHVAVGREDLADAGGALGPWPARWALDSVGHPLQQALTWEAPECGQRQQSPSAPSSQENRALGLPEIPQQGRSPVGFFC